VAPPPNIINDRHHDYCSDKDADYGNRTADQRRGKDIVFAHARFLVLIAAGEC
jgi:hypothetical protein